MVSGSARLEGGRHVYRTETESATVAAGPRGWDCCRLASLGVNDLLPARSGCVREPTERASRAQERPLACRTGESATFAVFGGTAEHASWLVFLPPAPHRTWVRALGTRFPSFLVPSAGLAMTSSPAALVEVETAMLIRRPAAEVFAAFVEPDQITRFWFSRTSGPLAPGAVLEWTWEPYGVSATVTVLAFEEGRRLVTEWPGASGPTIVEYRFVAQPDGATWVRVRERGFRSEGAALAREVADSTQGFTLVLAGLKAWCEHGLQLNLIWDRHPPGLVEA